jgi:hypothetical protein
MRCWKLPSYSESATTRYVCIFKKWAGADRMGHRLARLASFSSFLIDVADKPDGPGLSRTIWKVFRPGLDHQYWVAGRTKIGGLNAVYCQSY